MQDFLMREADEFARQELLYFWVFSETLAFLDATLKANADLHAVIFAHCPLSDTVLDRDLEQNLDDDSQDPFFFVENSQDVRTILASHPNAKLYISGHTFWLGFSAARLQRDCG